MNIEIAREKMVEQQVRAWDVLSSSVLDVMASVPREHFVPRDYQSLAFADTEIPLGYGESMMTPTVEGRVLEAIALQGDERVLEIGTGSGFLTACMARLADHVTSIDIHETFVKRAIENLADARIDNVTLQAMDAMQELPAGQFDAVVVTGSLPHFDPRFVESLADGGKLFVVVGSAPVMDARLVQRTGNSDWESTSLFETVLKPLLQSTEPAPFRF